MEMIRVENLTKSFNGRKALDSVNLTLNKKDIYGLIGKNGAGKTTLMRLVLGSLFPTEGNVAILGKTSPADLNVARSDIGSMTEPTAYSYLSARQNLEYYYTLKGLSEKGEVDRLLELVGLQDVKKPYRSFSMGMKKRLSLAIALLGSPDILLLDEPTNGLDPMGIADFRELIIKLNRERETSLLISSHILTELGLVATRFGFIDEGHLIREVSAEELEAACRRSILLAVSDPAKTVLLLEEKLHTQNYKVKGDREIELYDRVDHPEEVAHLLVTNGVSLYKMAPRDMTLEEYYLQLIGGGTHA